MTHLYEELMNPLFEIYGFVYPMNWVRRFQVKFQRWDRSGREAEMFVMAAMTVLCTAGIAFSIRFLVALSKECKPRRIGYWLRMRLGSGENAIAELQERQTVLTRAA